jgi:hypothetical protein
LSDIQLQAQDFDKRLLSSIDVEAESQTPSAKIPSELDWILSGSIKSYKESGTPINSGQVNPYMFTKTLTELAEKNEAKIVIGSATRYQLQRG